jgi:hypothetical protein
MAYSSFFYQRLARIASSAEAIEYDLIVGKLPCLQLAEQWAIVMRKLNDKHLREEAEDFFRSVYAHMFPDSETYYKDKDHFARQHLRDKVLETYGALSAVGRGDSELALIAKVILAAQGVRSFCDQQLNAKPLLRLPAPPTNSRIVSNRLNLRLYVNE